jgi:hypothetical protein
MGETPRTPSGVDLRAYALSRETGAIVWSTLLPVRVLESQSPLTLDLARGQVLAASGRHLTAIDLATGTIRWQATLPRNIVNAAAIVVDEDDEHAGRARAFITDYSGFSTGAGLSCINLDPLSPSNPFAPGAVLWRAPIGAGSGNTPAYLPRSLGGVGLVYTAAAGQFGALPGRLIAFSASSTTEPAPTFSIANPILEGFYGAIAIKPEGNGTGAPTIAAASYAFFGALDSANLLIADARSGAVISSTPCNRTQSTPIRTLPGAILLSTGIAGFGSAPALERFDTSASTPALTWNSAIATFNDLNNDSLIDVGEYTPLAGWIHQPLLMLPGAPRLMSATVQGEGLSDASASLRLIDPAQSPTSPAFIVDGPSAASSSSLGGNPAIAGSNIYALTPQGLAALGPTPAQFDRNADTRLTIDDLYAWEAGARTDLDADGTITAIDTALFRRALRWSEAPAALTRARGGRR